MCYEMILSRGGESMNSCVSMEKQILQVQEQLELRGFLGKPDFEQFNLILEGFILKLCFFFKT